VAFSLQEVSPLGIGTTKPDGEVVAGPFGNSTASYVLSSVGAIRCARG
jgi:hypothetical protein